MPGERGAPPIPRGRFLLLSAGGLGALRPAPGTLASFATAALLLPAANRPWLGAGLALGLVLYGTCVTLAFGGVRGRRGPDPSWIVSDEVAGQALAGLGAVPFGGGWLPLLAAFVLFRVFDIVKWGPVGRLERVPGGLGVLLDDLGAGALAGALVALAGLLGAF